MKWCLLKNRVYNLKIIYDLDHDSMGCSLTVTQSVEYSHLLYIELLPAIMPHDISPPNNMDTPLVAFKARVEAK